MIPNSARSDLASESNDSMDSVENYSEDYLTILSQLMHKSLPLILSLAVFFTDRPFIVYLLKEQNSEPLILAVSGQVSSWLFIFSAAIVLSLNGGIVTRCGQAFGAKRYPLIGYILHKALIINIIGMIISIFMIFFSYKIFEWIKMDPALATHLYPLLVKSIPGIICYTIVSTLWSVMNGCQQFKWPGAIQLFGAASFWLVAWILIKKYNYGLEGQILSYNIMWAMDLALTLIAMFKFKVLPEKVLFIPDLNSVRNLWKLLKFLLLIGSMNWIDVIAMEILTIFSSMQSINEIAALNIGFIIFRLLFPLYLGTSGASGSLIAGAMGRKNQVRAKKIIITCLTVNLLGAALSIPLMLLFKKSLIGYFTQDDLILQLCENLLDIFVYQIIADCVQMSLASGIKSVGKERAGALAMIAADYVVCIPLAYYLGFSLDLRINGLVIGRCVSSYCKVLLFLGILLKTGWDKEIQRVSKLLDERDSFSDLEDIVDIELIKMDNLEKKT